VRDGDDAVAADSRTTGTRPAPANKLSEGERAEILAVDLIIVNDMPTTSNHLR
jgi:hypothetical protein